MRLLVAWQPKQGGDEYWCSAGFFLIFEHVSGGAHRCSLLCMHMWWAEVSIGCVLLTLSTLLFEVGSLTKPVALHLCVSV